MRPPDPRSWSRVLAPAAPAIGRLVLAVTLSVAAAHVLEQVRFRTSDARLSVQAQVLALIVASVEGRRHGSFRLWTPFAVALALVAPMCVGALADDAEMAGVVGGTCLGLWVAFATYDLLLFADGTLRASPLGVIQILNRALATTVIVVVIGITPLLNVTNTLYRHPPSHEAVLWAIAWMVATVMVVLRVRHSPPSSPGGGGNATPMTTTEAAS